MPSLEEIMNGYGSSKSGQQNGNTNSNYKSLDSIMSGFAPRQLSTNQGQRQRINELMNETFLPEAPPNSQLNVTGPANIPQRQPNLLEQAGNFIGDQWRGLVAGVQNAIPSASQSVTNMQYTSNDRAAAGGFTSPDEVLKSMVQQDRQDRIRNRKPAMPDAFYRTDSWRQRANQRYHEITAQQKQEQQTSQQKVVGTMQNQERQIQNVLQQNNVQPNNIAYNVVTGAAKMAPALVVSAITKNPVPFISIAGMQSYGDTYAALRQQGVVPEKANQAAMVSGGINAAASAIPIHNILNPTDAVLKAMAKNGVTMGALNGASAVLDYGIQNKILDRDMSFGEAMQRMGEASVNGLVTGALFTGATRAGELGNALRTVGENAATKVSGLMERLTSRKQLQDVPIEQQPLTAPQPSFGENLSSNINGMTHDQIRQALYTSEKAGGIYNEAAYKEAIKNPKPYQVAIDLDGMKEVNDTYGHDGGDLLIKTFGTALKNSGIEDVFHLHGDEYAAQGIDKNALHTAMQKVDDYLKSATIEVTDKEGNIHHIKSGGFSYGIGTNPREADTALYEHKAYRESIGLRHSRRDVSAQVPDGINQAGENTTGFQNNRGNLTGRNEIGTEQQRIEPAQPLMEEPVSVFKTSQGSVYQFDGTTTVRNKSLHKMHDSSDVGLKSRSEKTIFISPDLATEIGMWNTGSNSGKKVVLSEGRVYLLSDNSKTGKPGIDKIISDANYSDNPSIGKSPLELWEKDNRGMYSNNHPGNKIVEIEPENRKPVSVSNRDYALGIINKAKVPFNDITPRNTSTAVNFRDSVSPTVNKIIDRSEPKITLKSIAGKVYQKVFDNQHSINSFSKEVGSANPSRNPALMAANSRSVPGTVNHILREGLVNKEGRRVGNSFKSIVDQVPKKYETEFNDYLLHRHNIGRMAQEKPVFGESVTTEMSQGIVSRYEAKFPEFKNIAQQYDKFMTDFMKNWGVDSGLVPEDLYNKLKEMYPHYTPTYRAMEEAATGNTFGNKRSFTGQSSLIKKATGSERNILNPLATSMGMVDKTVKAAKYNEVGQTIVEAVRKDPEGLRKWAEIVQEPEGTIDPGKTVAKDGMEGLVDELHSQYDKPKLNGKSIVRVMEKGKPVYLKINDVDFLESVTGLINHKPGEVEKIARKITGPYKSLITGKNPIFAIKNIARDIPTAYINGSEKNPFRFIADLSVAAKDMASNNQMFQEYKALGGGSSGFFKGDIGKLYKGEGVIGRGNEAIESIPRYAEYKRTVERGGGTYDAKMQGLFNANELTVDFSRHGNFTKTVDAYAPYLNPGVQGIDKLVRQVIKHPFATVGKGVAIITIPQVALTIINQNNPYYQQLDNRTKDSYYCIPIPPDAKTFVKIPKSREYGVIFADLFDRVYRGFHGDRHAFDGYGNTFVTNFSPTNPFENNIASPFITNLPSNKDFAKRTIVPMSMQKRSPRLQYDDTTSEISKIVGDKLNISPKQSDYLIRSYTGVIGQFLLPITTKSGTGTARDKAANVITKNFIADPLYSNDIVNSFYEKKTDLETKKADAKALGKRLTAKESVALKYYNRQEEMISRLYDKLKEAGSDGQKRMYRQMILNIAKKTNDRFGN